MRVCGLNKSYGKQEIFKDFSLEIREGEILCLLGESGGGKTTLLNILAGLVPFEGTVEGVPQEKSYIFQESRLLPNLTVRENLAFVGASPDSIERLLAATELTHVADKRPSALSGGERQRVSIARAFCVPFSLLLMDEPFSSLDTALKIRLSKVFARLWTEEKGQDKKRTAIFVTHDLEEALMLADRIVLLKKGKIFKDVKVERRRYPSEYGEQTALREELLQAMISEA